MHLRKLLILHGLITFFAGIMLIAFPTAIPGTVDIALDKPAYLLSYFLGAAEIAIAYLSYAGKGITDDKALRIICIAFILFHTLTAVVEVLAFAQGGSLKLWANVALRIIISALFYYYGLYKIKTAAK